MKHCNCSEPSSARLILSVQCGPLGPPAQQGKTLSSSSVRRLKTRPIYLDHLTRFERSAQGDAFRQSQRQLVPCFLALILAPLLTKLPRNFLHARKDN